VNAFLQHKSMKQMQDYLARGRRCVKLDVEGLNKDWIIAVRSWLARNRHKRNDGSAYFRHVDANVLRIASRTLHDLRASQVSTGRVSAGRLTSCGSKGS
jgi:hypothetical protein